MKEIIHSYVEVGFYDDREARLGCASSKTVEVAAEATVEELESTKQALIDEVVKHHCNHLVYSRRYQKSEAIMADGEVLWGDEKNEAGLVYYAEEIVPILKNIADKLKSPSLSETQILRYEKMVEQLKAEGFTHCARMPGDTNVMLPTEKSCTVVDVKTGEKLWPTDKFGKAPKQDKAKPGKNGAPRL